MKTNFLLTNEKKIILYLEKYHKFCDSYAVTSEVTQDGIATALLKSRNYIAELLSGFMKNGLIEEKTVHIIGEKRRRKAYFLTTTGMIYANSIKEELKGLPVVVISEDGTQHVTTVSSARDYINVKPAVSMLDILIHISKHGVLDCSLFKRMEPQKEKKGVSIGRKQTTELATGIVRKKICLIGDPAVGKTCLIRRFVQNMFDENYVSTIGTNVTSKNIMLRKHPYDLDINVKLMIWDMMGQILYEKVQTSAYLGAKGAFLVCDFTRKETLLNAYHWIDGLFKTLGEIPVILLVNKNDLWAKRAVDVNEIKSVASELGIPFYFTSAKTGENVEMAFYLLTDMMIGDEEAREILKERTINKPYTIASVTDEIIDDFCNKHGGYEVAMPIVRDLIKKTGFDLAEPTIDGLKILVENMVMVPGIFATPQEALEQKRKYLELIGMVARE